ncbi:Golgi reassembly stacking protein 2 [Favolaschia claudopus]|uniref:Golgi reassembly stacking protein 2 n=1 Tax=Favolaschia claudopus TaxID=2862362 RepID=A0AAW0DCA1_9AGAR
MFLCRRILLQIEFGRFPRLPLLRRNISLTAGRSQNVPVQRTEGLQTTSKLFDTLFSLPAKRTDKMEVNERLRHFQAYKQLRMLDRQSLARLPLNSYFALLTQATYHRQSDLSNQLVADMLECAPQDQLQLTLLRILSSHAVPLLRPRTILLLLQRLADFPGALDRLSLPAVTVLAHTFAEALPDPADESLLELIYPILLTQLQGLRPPKDDAILTYKPPDIIHASFMFVDKLLQLSQAQRAYEIFQFLVNSGNVPSETLHTIPGLEDFESIMRSSLVRASMHWYWRPLAERFLTPLLKPTSNPGPHTLTLTKDTLYGCLNEPSIPDLVACRSLISKIHPFSPVPNAVIREYYLAAYSIDASEEAYALYAFTQSPDVLKTHLYATPRADALAWLVRHLLNMNSHLAQDLVQQILDRNILIPVEYRPSIVRQLAERGHAGLARALYERFSVGKDRLSFVQNPSMYLRMVSAFNHLVQKDDRFLDEAEQGRDDENEENEDSTLEAVRQRRDDCRWFLGVVMSQFAHAHPPIHECSHQVITTQARAFFIIGEFFRGFETVKALLERKEMPDVYDINVTLTVMAQHDPRTALQIVRRMVDKGLQPDHVTFGTIMHHALAHGDVELVNEMVQRVRELGAALSYKSIVSLIRGSIAFDAGSPPSDSAQASKLQSAFQIIQSITRSSVVYNPHLGKFLVRACLGAEDPTMAFRFWELLIKDKARQDDIEHIQIRKEITRALGQHRAQKWIKDMHARAMIAQLRMGEVFSGSDDIR